MMQLGEAAIATRGVMRSAPERLCFTGVSSDTRAIAAGDLFVALKGERFDGHDYVLPALAAGAVAALVDAAWAQSHADLPVLAVSDTRRALGDLAAHWRGKFSLPLIGITGSNGKTTVKEMCAAILREQAERDVPGGAAHEGAAGVLATVGNLNNDIGLPLMLLKLRRGHRAAVIEMGMNHPGEIAYLTRIARPTVALINNAQRAHLEGLGGLAGVAQAKGEIFAGLLPAGVAVINADDPHAALWRQLAAAAGAQRIVSFGLQQPADVAAQCSLRPFGCLLQIGTPRGSVAVELQVPGRHNAMNALAATAATLAAGIGLDVIAAGLGAYRGIKGRLQRRSALNAALVIDDSYNANPDSMRVAIEVLAALPGKKILVLGDMGEVGAQSGQFHDEIGGYAKSMGVDRLLALGEHAAAAVRNFGGGGEHFKNLEALLGCLRPMLDADTTVLVKGSRFMKMERVVEAITQNVPAAGPPQGGDSQQSERAQPANTRHPLPREGGRGEGS